MDERENCDAAEMTLSGGQAPDKLRRILRFCKRKINRKI